MFEAKKLVMVSLWKLPKELSDFFRNMHDGVCNDVSKVMTGFLPTYDELANFEEYVINDIMENELYCTPTEYLGDNKDIVFIHELFKLDQNAFIGYEGIVVDMSW